MYQLDINILIAISQDHPLAKPLFELREEECSISTIVLAELYKGAYCSQKVIKNLTTIENFIDLVEVVDFDLDAAVEFGKIQSELRLIGKPTGLMDAAIAAIARSRQDIIVTANVRDFENIPNLQIENWLNP
jgi:tRNA(fMet)-specific endonuclease VapC